MTAFELETELFAADFDLNAMRREWMKVSGEKGWLMNEEGWTRYLQRVKSTGTGPKLPQVRKSAPVTLPAGFADWWKEHPHSGWCVNDEGEERIAVEPRLAWTCVRYRKEWDALSATMKLAA